MNDTEKVVRHLEIIQAVINRLESNGFLVKGWSMTLIVAAMVLIARLNMDNPCFILVFILPSIVFWILDAYFLRHGRLFRHIYDEIRLRANTDFEMKPLKYKNEPDCRWISVISSATLIMFYITEIVLIVSVFFIIKV